MDPGLDRSRAAVNERLRFIIIAPPLVFLGVFYFFPIFSIFWESFVPNGIWNPNALTNLFTSCYYLKILWFTFWQASVSTLLTLLVGIPGAYVMTHYRFMGKEWLQALSTVPFVMPTVVVAAAFRSLLGRNGLLGTILGEALGMEGPMPSIDNTIWIILLAHVFYNYSIVLKIVGGYWVRMETSVTEAARMLGASPWKTFTRITLPLLKPAILASALLVFVFCFTSFGVILILGGPRFATLEVEIYRQAVHMFDLPTAAALSLVQIVFTFAVMWVYSTIQRQSAVPFTPEAASGKERPVETVKDKLFVGTNSLFMLIVLCFPLLSLVLRSLQTSNGLSLRYYLALFQNPDQSIFYAAPMQAMINSALIAIISTGMALALGLMAAIYLAGRYSRWAGFLDPVFMLPLSTSAVTLGFGFIIALDEPPLNLRTTFILAPLAHTLVAFPFVVRTLLPSLRGIPERLREAAHVLGASPGRAWLAVDFPIIGRAILVSAVFAFSISLGEFGATVFVARPQWATMPLAIYRYLGQPGAMNYGQAMAMSSLLMLFTATAFILMEKYGFGTAKRF